MNIQNNKKVFFFEDNREILYLKEKPFNKYKYDYIFSESENPMIISSTLNTFIYPLIEQEKNLIFLSIGKKNLNSSNFIFGSNNYNLLGADSLFNYTFKTIKQIMKGINYDKILFELYKIVNDKFVVDFKEIINDINSISYIEKINQHIKKLGLKGKQSKSLEMKYNEDNEGHIILKIKFFKFITNNDLSKSQRQIEIIRTFSYIDIKDDEEDNYIKNSAGNNKINSIFYFKKMIQSITNYDLNKFIEISSNLTDILRDIFSIPNLYSFIFGLINEYKDDLDKSLKTLNLLNTCKNIDHNKFYNKLENMNLTISKIENKALKQDFQILNIIFGEMIYYLEKTYKKLDKYFIEVKDIELKDKFFYLKQWLINNGYPFQKNQKFCIILENILGYIRNRAQWIQLMKAKEMIMKLNENIKNNEKNYSININNINNKYKIIRNNEIYSLNNKTYNKIEINNNLFKNKIFPEDSQPKIFQDSNNNKNIINNNINKEKIMNAKNEEKNKKIIIKKNNIKENSSTFGLSDLSCFDSKRHNKNEIFNSRSIGEFPTCAKSIESSFTQKLLKGLQGNFRHLFTDIYERFTKEEDSGCFICKNDYPIIKNYKLNCQKWINEYKSLSQLETGINMDKISMIYTKSNKNNNSYYDKDEEIKIHFLDDENSIKDKKNIKNNQSRNIYNKNEIKNNKTFNYDNKRNK